MEKGVLLISRDVVFVTQIEELIRGRGFLCVTVNNFPDSYEALRRAHYDLVVIDSEVGAKVMVREFARHMFEFRQKALLFISTNLTEWEGVEVPFMFRASIVQDFLDWLNKVFQD